MTQPIALAASQTTYFSSNLNSPDFETRNISERNQDVNGSDETSKFYPMSPEFPNASPPAQSVGAAEPLTPNLNASAPFLFRIINDYEKSVCVVDTMLKEQGLKFHANADLSQKLEILHKAILS